MKVKVKDLMPNPFRHLERYPIDKAKVDRLGQSIKHTGFWDNIVAREKDGQIQIAYGHHRMAALNKVMNPNDEVDVIVKDLDDETMIKIMADENDDVYNMTPAVINETVRVARDWIARNGAITNGREGVAIAKFLDWHISRVNNALADINAISSGEIVEEVEKLPSQHHSTTLRQVVKKHNISPAVQRKIIETVQKNGLGYRAVSDEVHKYVKKSKDDTYEELLNETSQAVRAATKKLKELVRRREGIASPLRQHQFKDDLEELMKILIIIKKIAKGGNYEE